MCATFIPKFHFCFRAAAADVVVVVISQSFKSMDVRFYWAYLLEWFSVVSLSRCDSHYSGRPEKSMPASGTVDAMAGSMRWNRSERDKKTPKKRHLNEPTIKV